MCLILQLSHAVTGSKREQIWPRWPRLTSESSVEEGPDAQRSASTESWLCAWETGLRTSACLISQLTDRMKVLKTAMRSWSLTLLGRDPGPQRSSRGHRVLCRWTALNEAWPLTSESHGSPAIVQTRESEANRCQQNRVVLLKKRFHGYFSQITEARKQQVCVFPSCIHMGKTLFTLLRGTFNFTLLLKLFLLWL